MISIIEPSPKNSDDRTWSYWAKDPLLPTSVKQQIFSKIELATDGKRQSHQLNPYRYYSVHSSTFYKYAKEVLAKAGVTWLNKEANDLSENSNDVEVTLSGEERIRADYVLDSRPPKIEMPTPRYNATLQHFGGWFVEMPINAFDSEEVVFMDFIDIKDGVAFFYVVPTSSTEALVEIAVFSEGVWDRNAYDDQIHSYILEKYQKAPSKVFRKEYGVIPMTDEPLWKKSTKRVWNIGTRGGWVQPSSGYAFTRIARFAKEVAQQLTTSPQIPWSPSPVQQVFNSVMLGYVIDNPKKAGAIFYNLFAENGPERTFDFLDESATFRQTVQLMWSCPQLPFAKRAIKEIIARVSGAK